jgi:hypothetical protein
VYEHELDLDRASGALEPVSDRARIAESYAAAVSTFPELAPLLQ